MSDYSNAAAFRRAERAYLEPPEEKFPPGTEDLLDTVILWPDTDEQDPPEFGRIVEYEDYDCGVTLTVRHMDDPTRKTQVEQNNVDAYEVGPDMQDIVDHYWAAERAEATAQRHLRHVQHLRNRKERS
jgi:hypothetical protein